MYIYIYIYVYVKNSLSAGPLASLIARRAAPQGLQPSERPGTICSQAPYVCMYINMYI